MDSLLAVFFLRPMIHRTRDDIAFVFFRNDVEASFVKTFFRMHQPDDIREQRGTVKRKRR